jgi:hypothetical protein
LPPTYVFLSACLFALIAAVATAFLALPGRRTSSIAALGMASVKVLVFDLLADDANPDVARQALKRLIYDNLLQLRGHYASFLNSNPGVTLTGIGILAKIIAPQRRYSPIVRELPEASRTFDTFMVRSQSPCRPYIFFVGRLPPGSRHWHAALRRAPLRCSSAKITGHRICLPMT